MAITPWSWTASNGTATDLETQTAYTAITTKGCTVNFSHKVWNDLVTKTSEVVTEISREWQTTYGSIAMTNIPWRYGGLTSDRFNAVLLNTNIPTFPWAYDSSREGYIGRKYVQGVTEAGQEDADTVYGWYILELARELNVLIAIINGGGSASELLTAFIGSCRLDANPIQQPTLPLTEYDNETLTCSSLMEAEDFPGITLHFIIAGPTLSALLETEDISSLIEAHMYMTCNFNGKTYALPSVSFGELTGSGEVEAESIIHALQAIAGNVSSTSTLAHEVNLSKPGSASANATESHHLSVEADGVRATAGNPGFCHYELDLTPGAVLHAEMLKLFIGILNETLNVVSTMHTGQAEPGEATLSGVLQVLGGSVSLPNTPIRAEATMGDVLHSAYLGLTQYEKGLIAHSGIASPIVSGTLETEHVSRMLRAYLEITGFGHEANLEQTEPSVCETVFHGVLGLPETLISDITASLEEQLGIRLQLSTDANVAQAKDVECAEPLNLGLIKTELLDRSAEPAESETAETLAIGSNAKVCHSDSKTAHIYPHLVIGSVANCGIAQAKEATLVMLASTMSDMQSGVLAPFDATDTETLTPASTLSILAHMASMAAEQGIEVAPVGNIGYVFYSPMATLVEMNLSFSALLETQGIRRWEYPTYLEGVLNVTQVYYTEQNREHIFLDPIKSVSSVSFAHSVNANADYYIYGPMQKSEFYSVQISSTLNFSDISQWERPVQTGTDVLVHQALDAHQKLTYRLEIN